VPPTTHMGPSKKERTTMTECELFIPAPRDRKGRAAWTNANRRHHWAVKAEMTRDSSTMANLAGTNAGLPKGLQRAHVTVYVHKTNNRPYDVHTLYGPAKAAIDGLVTDYGLLPDDSNAHLTGPDMRQGSKQDQAGITLTIKEIQ